MSGSTITGTVSVGITLGAGNYLSPLTVTSTGNVYPGGAGTTGINIGFNGGYVLNEGTVSGGPNGGIGVQMFTGTLVNKGYVTGGYSGSSGYGVEIFGGSVINDGTIVAGGAFDSAILQDGGVVVNNGVMIGNGRYGDQINAGTLINYGTLKGGANHNNGLFVGGGTVINDSIIQGVSLDGGAFLNNGTVAGLESRYGATFTNAGYIGVGTNGDAVLFGTGASRLIIDPGASFGGGVIARGAASKQIIELASGNKTGTLSGVGVQFSGFGNIEIDTASSWVISGDLAGLTNGEVISGFGPRDTVILDGFSTSTYSFVTGAGLELSGSGGAVTLDLTGSFQSSDFLVSNQGTDTVIVENALCFCAGTQIRTSRGDVPVESLKIGDFLKTFGGNDKPIKWIGTTSYDGHFITGQHLKLPICISRGAISPNVPVRDLWVSPGHGIYVEGVLVPAWRLVNGLSICQAERVDRVNYFNVEFEEHEIILAEGCPVESFLDCNSRNQFNNFAEYECLYPGETAVPVSSWQRVEQGFILSSIQRAINLRANLGETEEVCGPLRGWIDVAGPDIVAGWAQCETQPEVPVTLLILVGGEVVARVLANGYRTDLRKAGLGSGCHGFEVKLRAGVAGAVTVRRATDGLELALTEFAVSRAA